ncbi:MAG: hypothetical protein KME29_27845 [Calothrix sp. FI2-JRJ7]|nr:hypothetical protein [Calothrix sp. FI2-JRJ7]
MEVRTGTPHQLVFTIEATCRFRGRCLVAEGTGNNLREARQNAAHNLLTKVIEMYRNSWSTL